MGVMARWRSAVGVVLGLVLVGALPGVAWAEACPNEQFRTGASAALPDCRAYEMVSPADKNGGGVDQGNGGGWWQSAEDGSLMAFSSTSAFGDALSSTGLVQFYLASRGVGGWSSHALMPRQAPERAPIGATPGFRAFSRDLSKGVLNDVGLDDPPLVSGEPAENENLFLRDNNNDAYQLMDVTPAGAAAARVSFQGASSDFSHVVFSEVAKLTANAAGGEDANLYEWSGGAVNLVSVLPDSLPFEDQLVYARAVSEDGSRVVFSGNQAERLYLHEDGGVTVQVNSGGLGGSVNFQAATPDVSSVLFTEGAQAGLTGDTVAGSGENLYEYEVQGARVRDLTAVAHAEVLGVAGMGGDGGYVYFVARGALAAGAIAGQPNLYLLHEGAFTYIATLSGAYSRAGDEADWLGEQQGVLNGDPVRVTPDGVSLEFESVERLTGYDNTDVGTGNPDTEVFFYDAQTGRLVCVSCNPSGARPVGPSSILPSVSEENASSQDELHEAGVSRGRDAYRTRNLSVDGSRVFFNSFDALLPQDSNGRENVYEWEREGAGSCRRVGGCLFSISSGTSGENSVFADASASGGDVFFMTLQPLVSQDQDELFDLYDARVGGGYPPLAVSVGCDGEACRQGTVESSAGGVPGSVMFSGVGNVASPPLVVAKPKVKPKPRRKHRPRRRRVGRRAARRARGGRVHGKRG
jgi:hypothetical protein